PSAIPTIRCRARLRLRDHRRAADKVADAADVVAEETAIFVKVAAVVGAGAVVTAAAADAITDRWPDASRNRHRFGRSSKKVRKSSSRFPKIPSAPKARAARATFRSQVVTSFIFLP